MPSPATSRIVVLHLTKYSDHALILHTVDSVAGRCSYLVRGIKRGNAVAAFHPLSLLVAMFISEVLYRSFTNELSDPRFFDWLCEMIATLESAEGSVANFHLWFLVSYAVHMGFMPGEAIEPAGIFAADEAALFQEILRSSFDEAMAIPLSAARRQAFSRRMLQYLSWHLGTTIDARSLDVLHAVLA